MNKTLVLLSCLLLCLPAAAFAADVPVTQSHTTFDKEEQTVSVGDTVVFQNKDDVTHNIQIVDGNDDVDDKGLQKPGEDIKVTFDKPGAYKVRCAIHPKMKMTVTVK